MMKAPNNINDGNISLVSENKLVDVCVGFRDWVPKELQRVGCVELLNTVQKRVRPKLHAFGGIHEGIETMIQDPRSRNHIQSVD